MQYQSEFYQADGGNAVCLQQVTLKKQNLQVFLGILFRKTTLPKEAELVHTLSGEIGSWFQKDFLVFVQKKGPQAVNHAIRHLEKMGLAEGQDAFIIAVGNQILLQNGEQGGIFLLQQGFQRPVLTKLDSGLYEMEEGVGILLLTGGDLEKNAEMTYQQIREVAQCLQAGVERTKLPSPAGKESMGELPSPAGKESMGELPSRRLREKERLKKTERSLERNLREIVDAKHFGGAIYLEMR